MALYYHLLECVFPGGADKNLRKRIRYQCGKLLIGDDGRILQKNSGRELLHEGNALQKVKEVHVEGHLGILNTLDKASKFYWLKEGRKQVRDASDGQKAWAKIRHDKKVNFRRQFKVGDEVLLQVVIPESKFSNKWEGSYKVLKVNPMSGTYVLAGANSLKLKHPVNCDRVKLFNGEVKGMVPDVLVSKANEQFQRWVNSRVNVLDTWSGVVGDF